MPTATLATYSPRARPTGFERMGAQLVPAVVGLAVAGALVGSVLRLPSPELGAYVTTAALGFVAFKLWQFGSRLLLLLEDAAAERERLATALAALREAQEAYRGLAYHDALTGLPNRRLFYDRLDHALHHCSRARARLALLYLDLDAFKPVNDAFGHELGNRVLVEVSNRMRASVRAEDTVARLGGDEFIVLLPQVTGATDAEHVAAKVLASLRAPFALEGHHVTVQASIGISVFPDDGLTSDELVRGADAAMYTAKARGGARLARHGALARSPLGAQGPIL